MKTTLPTLGSSREGFRNGSLSGDCRGVSVLDEDFSVEAVPRAQSTSPATDEPATPAAATVQEQQGLLGSLLHDAAPDQGRAPCHPEGSWGGSAAAVDQARHPVPRRELRQMKGESVTIKSEKTTLEQWCSELRKAARRKQTLVTFCTEELGMKLTGNEVMARMEMKAMEILRAKCPAESQDVVGFGKHAGETYMVIKENRPDYARWVMDTWKECGTEGVDPRLARLAAWLLDQQDQQGSQPKTRPTHGAGYLTKEMIKKKNPEESTSSSTPTTSSNQDRLEKKLEMMADTMEMMRKELAEVKGERPRKSQGRMEDDSMSDGSFKVISKPPGTPS